MTAADRRKWNARYAAGAYCERPHPSAFLVACGAVLPRQGRALDLACGAGRNALFLARRGLEVDAVDISAVALRRGRRLAAELAGAAPIRWLRQDLDDGFEPGVDYDLIVNVRYVNLPLARSLIARLRPGGLLLVEQHLRCRADVAGPRNPAFRVRRGALKELAASLTILRSEERLCEEPDGATAAVAKLLAQRARD